MAKEYLVVGGATAQEGEKGWKAMVQEIITANVHKRVNGRVASNRTMEHNATVIFVAMKTLHYKLNAPVKNPYNLRDKHIEKLVVYWLQEGKAAATMRNDLSVLRKFFGWMGKPNAVRTLKEYLPDVDPERLRVSSQTKVTKSWSACGIDVEKKLAEAFAIDDRFGMMIALQLAFGLRRREAVRVRPWVSDQRDVGKEVFILYTNDGTKGGRQRVIPIEFPFQVWVLDYIKARVGKRSHMGWAKTTRGLNTTLEKNIKRYEYLMSKLGISKENCSVTGHGLRAEYAENCALLEGFTPATLGGEADQMSPEDLKIKLIRVSERLGHSRSQITAAYFGVFKKRGQKASDEKAPRSDVEVLSNAATPGIAPEACNGSGFDLQGAEKIDVDPTETPVATHTSNGLEVLNCYYASAPKGRERPDESMIRARAAQGFRSLKTNPDGEQP